MADITSLIAKVRVELGDLGKSFVQQLIADGTTNRFRLHYSPLDGSSIIVTANGVDVSSVSYIEESTGVLVVEMTHTAYPTLVADGSSVPLAGVQFSVSGIYYRYFTAAEITSLVTDAVAQHSVRHTDAVGRKITVDTLPTIEEYPVAVYATTLALYTLATDAAFDIDISAPDGVSIPRTERYRQLMEMIQTRQAQYRDLCVQLGVGLYSIEVFSLRRISKTTNRYVPVYKPQEVDDRSFPQRAHLALPTYGDNPVPWVEEGTEYLAYQGVAYNKDIPFMGNLVLAATVTNITASGTAVTYTASNNYAVGQVVTITGAVPTAYNLTNVVVTAASATSFTVASTVTGAYVSGGSVSRSAAVTGITGNGATITYTATNQFSAGDRVTITGVAPTAYDLVGATVVSATPTTFSVSGATTSAFVSGGTATLIGNGVVALAVQQRGSLQVVEHFGLTVTDNFDGSYIAHVNLTANQTMFMPNRTYWQIVSVDPVTSAQVEILGGQFFVERQSEVIL